MEEFVTTFPTLLNENVKSLTTVGNATVSIFSSLISLVLFRSSWGSAVDSTWKQ